MKSSIMSRTLAGYAFIVLIFAIVAFYQNRQSQHIQTSLTHINERYIPLGKILNQVGALANSPLLEDEQTKRLLREKLDKGLQLASIPAPSDLAWIAQRFQQMKSFSPPQLRQSIDILSRQIDRQIQVEMLQIEQKQNKAGLTNMLLMGIALIIALAITIFTGAFVLKPLGRLSKAVRNIGKGNFDTQLSMKGGEEIQTLAQEFNNMSQALAEREATLKQQHQELNKAERLAAVGKMAAQVTHEVRNPLNAINLSLDLLQDELGDLPNQQAKDRLALIDREVDSLKQISERYLNLARDHRPQLSTHHIKTLINDVYGLIKERCAALDIKVKVELGDNLPELEVDEVQLKQALWNLVINAIDATPKGGHIDLSAHVESNEVLITINDDGQGIPEAVQKNLFEPFFTTKAQGTGLGLSITAKIIQDHGGRIEIQSQPDHGTSFTIHLPTLSTHSIGVA